MDENLNILRSDLDKKEYRLIQLENGLRAILVSDVENLVSLSDNFSNSLDEHSETDKSEAVNEDGSEESDEEDEGASLAEKMAACALCINVGSFSDPPEIQGLAHFLEHMVFMGSVKYPKENALDEFLKNRGGSNNGATEYEYTEFYIECREAHLEEGMDLFAQFFISPLLIKEAMTREREAVDSEFEMALPSDGTRLEQLLGSLAPEGHPAKCFPWGNKLTLQELVDDEKLHRAVRDFWIRHYSAHRMTLAVVARLPLDILEKYVRNSFSDVPKRDAGALDFSTFKGMPWGPKFNCLLWVKPVYNLNEVVMTWVLPPMDKEYESRPLAYFSSLLGHEGEGSLLSYLKKKVLALKTFSGNDGTGFEFNSLYSVFNVTVELTHKGLERIDEVFDAVFAYIAMLREQLPNDKHFEELRDIASARFKYKPDSDPTKCAEDLAQNMHFYRPEHIIAGDEIFLKYNPDLILSFLKYLTAENVNISVHCKDKPDDFYDKEEVWFKTKYKMEEIPSSWKANWSSAKPLLDFSLPKVNPFTTRRFNLLPYDEGSVPPYPQKVLETPLIELWYRQDIKFKRPFATYSLYILSPCSRNSPLNLTLLNVFSQFVTTKLEERLYEANEAGYKWSCAAQDHGLFLHFYGYDEKLPLLYEEVLTGLKQVFDSMIDASNETLFAAIKCDIARSFYNNIVEPANLNNKIRLSLLTKNYISENDCLGEIDNITLEKMHSFGLEFFKSCRCFMLVQGNITKGDAIELALKLTEILNLSPCPQRPKTIVWNMVPGKEIICRIPSLNAEDNNSSITNYYQFGPKGGSIKVTCLLDLVHILMSEPLFNSLRTQQQVGYDVAAQNRYTFGVLGYSVTVEYQGNKFTPDEINQKIDNFLSEFAETLKNLTPNELEEAKENLIVLRRIEDNNLGEEVERNFLEIISGEYMFDRRQKEAEEIAKISHDEVLQLFDTIIGKDRKKLSTQITAGYPQVKENGKFILKPICPDPSNFISDIDKFLIERDFFPPLEVS